MESIINVLKQISEEFSTGQFVVICSVIIGVLFLIIKALIAAAMKRGVFSNLFSSSISAPSEAALIQNRLNELATRDQLDSAIQKVISTLSDLREYASHKNELDAQLRNEASKLHTAESNNSKQELENMSEQFSRELLDIKTKLDFRNTGDSQFNSSIKDVIFKLQEVDQRILSHCAKMDELARNAIPEFRVYHKDLSRDLSEISRDIALVERSIEAQIKNSNSIRLR